MSSTVYLIIKQLCINSSHIQINVNIILYFHYYSWFIDIQIILELRESNVQTNDNKL